MRSAAALFLAALLAAPAPALAQAVTLPPLPTDDLGPRVVPLTVDDAVAMSLENNLGIQIARLGPRVQDLVLAQIRAQRTSTISSQFNSNTSNMASTDFLSGGQTTWRTTQRLTNGVSVSRRFPWDGNLSVGWSSSRATDNNEFSTYLAQLSSGLSLGYTQPLTGGFIDSTGRALETATRNRDIVDLTLLETLASMARQVRVAYWDLAYQLANLDVQRQSYALVQESLRATRARADAGIIPRVDIVSAEAEVARLENDLITAEAQIEAMEDRLRLMVFDPDMPDFWTVRLELSAELPEFQPMTIDIDAAIRNALAQRTDLRRTRLEIENDEIDLRFARISARPNVSANASYQVNAQGGTRLQRDVGPFGPGTGDIIGESHRGYATVLRDLFGPMRPSWQVGISVSYPLGTSAQQVNLAQRQLTHSRMQVQARNQQTQVAMEVRNLGRQLLNTQRRVETSRRSRALQEQRLEAEQRRLDAGTGTSFAVFQAQRDLANARNQEVRAIFDYNIQSIDFRTVQEVPVR